MQDKTTVSTNGTANGFTDKTVPESKSHNILFNEEECAKISRLYNLMLDYTLGDSWIFLFVSAILTFVTLNDPNPNNIGWIIMLITAILNCCRAKKYRSLKVYTFMTVVAASIMDISALYIICVSDICPLPFYPRISILILLLFIAGYIFKRYGDIRKLLFLNSLFVLILLTLCMGVVWLFILAVLLIPPALFLSIYRTYFYEEYDDLYTLTRSLLKSGRGYISAEQLSENASYPDSTKYNANMSKDSFPYAQRRSHGRPHVGIECMLIMLLSVVLPQGLAVARSKVFLEEAFFLPIYWSALMSFMLEAPLVLIFQKYKRDMDIYMSELNIDTSFLS